MLGKTAVMSYISAPFQADHPLNTTDLNNCRLCPRHCGVDRTGSLRGFCGAGALPRIFRHGPHFGEEPPVSGTRGSGTVFFSHCTLRCFYCQNYPWSQEHAGQDLSTAQLRAIFVGLAEQGCHNWNLVSPTPWLPQIRAAVEPLFERDRRLPFVYNTSGFESTETLDAYRDLVDVALTDLRYANAKTAEQASQAGGYVEVARTALRWFWRELGPLQLDSEGLARRGTICRLLVLPGLANEAVDNLAWIARNIGTDLHISVMSQYTPVHAAAQHDGWNRRVTAGEYRRVTDAAEELGFENGWIQPYEAADAKELLGCRMPAGEGAVGQ
jgi:putative pyruvate formate lyase activating enzyme